MPSLPSGVRTPVLANDADPGGFFPAAEPQARLTEPKAPSKTGGVFFNAGKGWIILEEGLLIAT